MNKIEIHIECCNILNRITLVGRLIKIEKDNIRVNQSTTIDCTDNHHAIESYSRFINWLRKKYNKNIESLELI